MMEVYELKSAWPHLWRNQSMLARQWSKGVFIASAVTICFLVQPAWCITWDACGRQEAAWYKTTEAVRIADNVILFQADIGGWYKYVDSIRPRDPDRSPSGNYAIDVRSEGEKKEVKKKLLLEKYPCTLDNGATHSEMRYLAKVYAATGRQKYRDGFLKGVHYLLKAQYPSGGWPQFYPLRPGYSSRITFNDGAMIGAMRVLDDVANRRQLYDLADEGLRTRCKEAVRKGLECILECQIVVDGKKTAWCQQHNEVTLKPAQGRVSENPSNSGAESVDIVRYLMAIAKPSAEVIDAVESAAAWFDEVKITGVRVITVKDDGVPGGMDRRVVNDPKAGPIWARYYEIGTNRPMYIEQGVVKYSLAELSHRHRMAHGWIGGRWPERLLKVEYPAWRARVAPKNVVGGRSDLVEQDWKKQYQQ